MSKSKTKLNVKKVGVLLKPKTVSDYTSVLPNLVTWLKRRKIQAFFSTEDKPRVEKILKGLSKNANFTDLLSLHKDMDLNITLGGDGTLLGFGRLATRNSAPIFGVNMGNLGFITEFPKAEFFEELALVLNSKCELKKVPLYKVQAHKNEKKVYEAFFLNDIVVSKNDISRMFSLSVENSQELIYNISGDGLIVSSPIGSTAYSLAAGGPILSPEVNALVLTPICPHSLTHRPIVISDRDAIKIKVPTKNDSVIMTLDGQEVAELSPRSVITITKSTTRFIKIVTNPERTYFQTLKEKFTHGRRSF
jgi:NAD+ kinase